MAAVDNANDGRVTNDGHDQDHTRFLGGLHVTRLCAQTVHSRPEPGPNVYGAQAGMANCCGE